MGEHLRDPHRDPVGYLIDALDLEMRSDPNDDDNELINLTCAVLERLHDVLEGGPTARPWAEQELRSWFKSGIPEDDAPWWVSPETELALFTEGGE